MKPDDLNITIKNFTTETDGCIGIYAQHLQSDFCYQCSADERFFMASIFKIPIAICCLKLIEQGKLHLTDPIEILPTDSKSPYFN